ncbi:MAG: DUF983 domain-containing protein [Actinomycetes bacterium]
MTTARMVVRGLVRRCPRCGGRGVFCRWLTMRERCPTCGVRFDRKPEEAFFLGAFVIQTALILLPLAVLLFLFGMATGGIGGGRPEVYVAIMVAHVLITPFLTYPSTKTTWFAFDLAMGGLEPHEQREAEAAVTGGALPTKGR